MFEEEKLKDNLTWIDKRLKALHREYIFMMSFGIGVLLLVIIVGYKVITEAIKQGVF